MTPRAKIISRILMAAIAVAVFAADQVTKAMVESRIPERAVVPVVPGFFNLTNTKNSGAVFGIFSDSPVWWKTPLLIVISAALLIAVVILVVRTQNLRWETQHRAVADSGRRALQSLRPHALGPGRGFSRFLLPQLSLGHIQFGG